VRNKTSGYIPIYKRTFVVNREYQLGFVIRLLAIVLAGAGIFMATFYLLSQGTMSVSYEHYDIRLGRSSNMLMPQVLTATLIYCVLTGLTVALITIVVTHRMAGPVHRIVKTVSEMQDGDMTPRIRLRKKDSTGELADALNRLFDGYADVIQGASGDVHALAEHLKSIKARGGAGIEDLDSLDAEVRVLIGRLAFFRNESAQVPG